MSARPVTQSQIICDGCAIVYPHLAAPVAETRKLARDDGWKYRAVRYEQSNRNRQIDLCPDCEEPKP